MAGRLFSRFGDSRLAMASQCLIVLLVALSGVRQAGALEVHGAVSLGHDSNPAQTPDAEPALSFAHYKLSASKPLAFDASDLTFTARGWYRDYEGSNDSHRLTAAGDWSRSLEGGLARLSLGAELSAYRDRLVPADERDEFSLLLNYRRLLSARMDLAAAAEWLRADYRNPALPGDGRPGPPSRGSVRVATTRHADVSGFSGRPPRPGPGFPPMPALPEREDELLALNTEATYHWSPAVSSGLQLRLSRRNSNLVTESYERYGIGLSLALQPVSAWRAGLIVDWDHLDYASLSVGPRRDDESWSFELSVARDIGDGELFCRLRHLSNHSTVEVNSFDQTVTHCGLSWDF